MLSSQVQIKAPPTISYRPAPHGLRIAAWFIDLLIIVLVVAFLPQPIPPILPLAFLVAYHTVLIWLVEQTPGKALMGLKVKRIGHRTGFFWALGRASLGYFLVDVLGLGALAVFANWQHRCLHDYAFGSVVVYVEEPGRLSARVLSQRLKKFAQRQKLALENKKKRTVSLLISLWGFLEKLAGAIQKAVNILTGSPDPKPSIAQALTLKAALMIAVVTTGISAVMVTYVPIVHAATNWVFTPRYLVAAPPTNTPTPTITATSINTPTSTATASAAATFTPSATISPTPSASPTLTPTPTCSPTPTFTPSATPTPTSTPVPPTPWIPTATLKPTREPTREPTSPPQPTPEPDKCGAICVDGTTSSATGGGACSYHGGVKEWLYPPDCP